MNNIKNDNIKKNCNKKCISLYNIYIISLDNKNLMKNYYDINLTINILYYGLYNRCKYIDNNNLVVFTYNIIKFINYINIWINLINFIINYIVLSLINNKNKYKWTSIIIKVPFYIGVSYKNYFYYFYMEITINVNIKLYNYLCLI